MLPSAPRRLLFSAAALSGLVAVSGASYTRECIATVRARWARDKAAWVPDWGPEEASIEFEVVSRGTAGTPYFARRRAEIGMTKCLKNYFEVARGEGCNKWLETCGAIQDDTAKGECDEHVTPYNDPIEDIIAEKLFKEKLSCEDGATGSNGRCRLFGFLYIDYLSSRSPVGGHGCGLPRGFETRISETWRFCGAGNSHEGCSNKFKNWCDGDRVWGE